MPWSLRFGSLLLASLVLLGPLSAEIVCAQIVSSPDQPQQAPPQDEDGDGPGPSTPSPLAPLYAVSGKVVNALTGEAVPRAKISLYAGQPRAALTAPDGSFHFSNVPAGQCSLNAEKPGFFAEFSLPQSNHVPDMVTVGPQTPPVLVKLVPAALVTGNIRNQSGEPLAGIPVEIFRRIMQSGRFRWMQQAQAATDEDGDFRIPDLLPETYLLRYGPRWTTNAFTAGKTMGYPAEYLGNAATQAAAAPLKISAGQTLPLEIAMHRMAPITITGVLAGLPERAYPQIQVFDEDGEEVPAQNEDRSSRDQFTLHFAAPGTYTLRVTARTPDNTQPLFGETKLPVNASASGIVIALAPAPTFAIQVTADHVGAAAQTAPGGVIAGIAPTDYQNFRLVPLSKQLNEYSSQFNPKTKSNRFTEVLPGAYHFDTYPQGTWYVTSASIAGRDIWNEPFDVASGQSGTIEVTMRDDGASLTGTIPGLSNQEDATGSAAKMVRVNQPSVLLVSDARPYSPQMSPAWQGNFNLSAIAPGSYKLYAFDHIDQIEYMNPAVLEHYSGTSISFNPGEQKNITLNLIHVNP